MTAWTKGLKDAPRDKPILVRLTVWDCPAVMKHAVFDEEEAWCFVEDILSNVAGGLDPDEIEHAEWALMPE